MTNGDLKKLLIYTGGKITGESIEADRERIVKYWLIRALENGLENAINEWAENVRKTGYN